MEDAVKIYNELDEEKSTDFVMDPDENSEDTDYTLEEKGTECVEDLEDDDVELPGYMVTWLRAAKKHGNVNEEVKSFIELLNKERQVINEEYDKKIQLVLSYL